MPRKAGLQNLGNNLLLDKLSGNQRRREEVYLKEFFGEQKL
jgi:hypothetical protein